MKKILTIKILIILLFTLRGYGQNYKKIIPSLPETTHDSIIFQHCIDSITKYVYLDSRKIKPYMEAAEEILKNESALTSRHKLDFDIQRIYNEYNYNNNLGVLKIIESNREMVKADGILKSQKKQFKYLEGYTLLTLGEIDNAQEIFYELLDIATANKDTSLMMQSLSSLGKVFSEQGDFANAEKYSLDYYALIPQNKLTHKATFYIELVQLYFDNKQYDKADFYNKKALNLADSLDLVDFHIDFLLQKVSICLVKDDVAQAKAAYRKARDIEKNIGNSHYLKRCMIAYATILNMSLIHI